MKLFDVVRIVMFRDNRFKSPSVNYQRNPVIGDVGTIIEVYSHPEPAFEVECSGSNGHTIWLEAMYPEEVQLNALQ